MKGNTGNKGNAEWQALNQPRKSQPVKLRLRPEDVLVQREAPVSLHSSRQGRGPDKERAQ